MRRSRESASTYLLPPIGSLMTATILLVRHAAHRDLGRILSGRAGDVPLSREGREAVEGLAGSLAGTRIDAVQTSPVRRAVDTAQALARPHGIVPDIAAPLDEIDFGAWEGLSFAALEQDPRWHRWNAERDIAVPPGGEPMAAVQARVLAHLRQVARAAAGRVIAMVSHADVIRAAVAGVLGLSLARLLAFDIDPGSMTRIEAGDWGERLVTLNARGI